MAVVIVEAAGETSGAGASRGVIRGIIRRAIKLVVFSVVTGAVLFPYPSMLARHIRHVRNLDAMVEGDATELAPWAEELGKRLDGIASGRRAKQDSGRRDETAASAAVLGRWEGLRPREVQREVEKFVYERVPYAWDWDTWGMADYMPRVAEMFAQAAERGDGVVREDCDGRAVLAASLMRRLSYESRLVTDLRHVWVTTPEGEWMGPGRAKTVVATSQGNKVDWWTAWVNVPRSISYGIAVFPLGRELIIVVAAFALSLDRRMGWRRALVGLALLVQGLLFMRAGIHLVRPSDGGTMWPAWVGLGHTAAGLGVLWFRGLFERGRRGTTRGTGID